MTVRNATTADKELLLELFAEFRRELPPRPYPTNLAEEDWWSQVERHLRDGVVLVAEADERAAGFAEAELQKGQVFVANLYVRPEARRRGIGTALLEHVAASARDRGLSHMELWVDSHNANAVRFYNELGFAEG